MVGIAPTRAATKVLKEEVEIEARTVSYFLKRGMQKAAKLVILDEASLCSNMEVKKLLELSKKKDFRLLMLGDSKQQGGVEAGKPFVLLQKHGMRTAKMTEVKRQKNKELLNAVYAAQKAVDSRFAKKHLEQSLNNVKNVINIGEAKNEDFALAVYKKFKELKDPLIMVPSNDLKDKVNLLLRIEFIKGEQQSHEVIRKVDKTASEMKDIKEYSGSEIIKFNQDIKAIGARKGEIFEIAKTLDKSLILKNKKKEIVWNPKRSKSVSIYEKKEILLAKGDKIRDSLSKEYTVDNVSKHSIKLKDERGKVITYKKENLKEIDYSYSSTTYSSQGRAKDSIIGVARSNEKILDLTTQRSFYVMLSRAKEEAYLITDNHEKLVKSLSEKTGDKTSAMEMLERYPKQQYIKERVKELLLDFKERHGIYISDKEQFIKRAEYEANSIDKYLKSFSMQKALLLAKIEAGIFFKEKAKPEASRVIEKYNDYKEKEISTVNFYTGKSIEVKKAQGIARRIINYEIAFGRRADDLKIRSIENSFSVKEALSQNQDISYQLQNTQKEIRTPEMEI